MAKLNIDMFHIFYFRDNCVSLVNYKYLKALLILISYWN